MRLQISRDKYIDIEIYRKKIKNINLRIYPNGSVKVSAPYSAKNKDIERFLKQKADWIYSNIEKLEKRRASNFIDTNNIRITGKTREVKILSDNTNRISYNDDTFFIHLKENTSALFVFENWWRKNAKRYFEDKVNAFMPLFEEYNIERPKINIRKMKSLWGSCTPKKKSIRFNYYLFAVPDRCIDYVVIHELAHLIYPNHGESFKAFLSKHMPDWKNRKEMLNGIPFIEEIIRFETMLKNIEM